MALTIWSLSLAGHQSQDADVCETRNAAGTAACWQATCCFREETSIHKFKAMPRKSQERDIPQRSSVPNMNLLKSFLFPSGLGFTRAMVDSCSEGDNRRDYLLIPTGTHFFVGSEYGTLYGISRGPTKEWVLLG